MVNKTLVLGIGNPILQDDGVGVYVVQQLKAECPQSAAIEFIDGGTLSFTLIGEIESYNNLIVIDAAELHAAPGTVKMFFGDDMDQFLGKQKNSSVHDVTLIDLMNIAFLSDSLPAKRVLIGIQPECLDLGTEPTTAIKNAIPTVCRLTMELLESWGN